VARLLLVVHTILAAAAVGAGTHAVLWLRRYCRHRGATLPGFASSYRFIRLALVLHALTFLVGNVMYPTYKVNVRMAYLENPVAVTTDFEQRDSQQRRVESFLRDDNAPRASDQASQQSSGSNIATAAQRIAKWFDIKEHILVLGLIAWLGLWMMVRRWDRETDISSPRQEVVVMGLAYFAAATLWAAAVIGILTAAWRAI
jgi:hypothetical protein